MNKNSMKLDDFLIENLKDKDSAREFLNISLETYLKDGNFEEFAKSLELVIKAESSISAFARETNLNRSNLYSIFNNKKKPQFETIVTILSKLGFNIKVA